MKLITPIKFLVIIGNLVLFSVYGYLYILQQKKYMGIWTLSWGINLLHYLFDFWVIIDNQTINISLNLILSLTGGLLLFYGTQIFLKKTVPRQLLYFFGLNIIWIAISSLINLSFTFLTLPIYVLITIFYVWTGIGLLKSEEVQSLGSKITGTSFILWGIHKLDYPFLKPISRIAPFGYLFSVILIFVIAFGILFMYFNKTRKELQKSEKKYRKLFNNADDAIFLNEITQEGKLGKFIEVNEIACQKSGLNKEKLLSMRPKEIDFKESQKNLKRLVKNIKKKKRDIFEVTLTFKDKEDIHLEINSHMFNLNDNDVLLSIARDITERKKAQKTIEHQALYDSLTNLPNRTLLKNQFNKITKNIQDKSQKLALILIDLNRFKRINDTLGYDIGDRLFKAIARRLEEITYPSDILVRMGSDEFGLLLTDISKKQQVSNTAEKIINYFEKPFIIEEYELYVTLSMGISIYPNDGKEIKTLISNADAAINHAKNQGDNSYQFFKKNMNKPSLQQLRLANDLRNAIKQNEFIIHYHPQINIKNNELKGMEALVRWQHSNHGLISPGRFIPLAEETGLIVKIDELVLQTACEKTKKLQEAGFNNLQISANLSPRHFQNDDLPEIINKVLKKTKLNPKYLELEITESAAIKNIESTIKILRELKNIGVQISIDDFGTGYSSLNYLKEMKVDSLKIDKSFIYNLTNDSNNQAITNTIINMAQNLNLEVIAEGVETKEQLNYLKDQNCHYAQGYLFGKPVPVDEIKDMLKKEKVSI